MRGKERNAAIEFRVPRITPAYAGKRGCRNRLCNVCKDHPRLCGEKFLEKRFKFKMTGSPPPMRGKGSRCAISLAFPRITPAYAGKSSQCLCERIETKDHPRLCGEKKYGKDRVYLSRRITPAYAGKRLIFTGLQPITWDHPRLCGEKRKLSRLLIFSLGSPPPMRGKDPVHHVFNKRCRITPAYAGKS